MQEHTHQESFPRNLLSVVGHTTNNHKDTTNKNKMATNNDTNDSEKEEEEASILQAFAKLWTDEQFHDVTLQANDGITITANRAALASRSEVFAKMLYGQFAEASSSLVKIPGYNGAVVRSLVEYIHTDHANVFDINNLDASSGRLPTLVDLAGAAMYYDLPLLCQKAVTCIIDTVDKTPSLVLDVLEACARAGPSVPPSLTKANALMLQFIRFNLKEHSAAVKSLSVSVLEDILTYDLTCMDEIDLFELLRLWAADDHPAEAATPEETSRIPNQNRRRVELNQERKSIALDLGKHIRLERIDPAVLSNEVASSGLVSVERILEAYKCQALSSKDQQGLLWERPRYTPCWMRSSTLICSSKNTVSGFVRYPPIVSGVHKWSLQPEIEASNCSMGILLVSNLSGSPDQ